MEFGLLLCCLFLVSTTVAGEMSPEFVYDALNRRMDSILSGRYAAIEKVVDAAVERKMNDKLSKIKQESEDIYDSKNNKKFIAQRMDSIESDIKEKAKNEMETVKKFYEVEIDKLSSTFRRYISSEKMFRQKMFDNVTEHQSTMEDNIDKLEIMFNETKGQVTAFVSASVKTIKQLVDDRLGYYRSLTSQKPSRKTKTRIDRLESVINETTQKLAKETANAIQLINDQCLSINRSLFTIDRRLTQEVNSLWSVTHKRDFNLRLAGGTTTTGRLEVEHNGQWGTICDDNWTNYAAQLACKHVSADFCDGRLTRRIGGGAGPIWLDDVTCVNPGKGDFVSDCTWSPWGTHDCDHSNDVTIACTYCTTPNGAVRLVDGYSPLMGRVEMFYNGAWGTVCDDSWDDDDAQVVCRQLGAAGGTAYDDAHFGRGQGRIFLDEVDCGGSERRLLDCRSSSVGNHNCNHNEDAGVSCTAN